MSHRLRVIVRNDLSPGAQIAQSIHAQVAFSKEHTDIERKWFSESNTIVILSVPDEHALRHLLRVAMNKGVLASYFEEPDFDNAMTAICLEPSDTARRLCLGLPKALEGR